MLWILACTHPDTALLLAERDQWRPDGLDEQVWRDATDAWACAVDKRRSRSPVLAVADLSKPSEARRFFVVDLETHETLVHDRVAHGSGSGKRFATRFSNTEGSHATSLGLYRAAEPYQGKHGLSLRLDGLEPANESARSRQIVVHGSTYIDDAWVKEHGYAGRSWGCFSVDPDISASVVDHLRGGALLLAWAKDPDWQSPFLGCPQ